MRFLVFWFTAKWVGRVSLRPTLWLCGFDDSPLGCWATMEPLANLRFCRIDIGDLIMQYRRAKTPGATYFFTVVTFRRRKILCQPDNVALLRTALKQMKTRHPFTIDAFVLLPEHLHCIWTLPSGDKEYSMRWNGIKGYFTRHCSDNHKTARSASQQRKRAQTIWQPRFWEHLIRDERDYEKHCDYIHWNPVKHGLVARVRDWPYSSFHRFVRLGIYSHDWTGFPEGFADEDYGE